MLVFGAVFLFAVEALGDLVARLFVLFPILPFGDATDGMSEALFIDSAAFLFVLIFVGQFDAIYFTSDIMLGNAHLMWTLYVCHPVPVYIIVIELVWFKKSKKILLKLLQFTRINVTIVHVNIVHVNIVHVIIVHVIIVHVNDIVVCCRCWSEDDVIFFQHVVRSKVRIILYDRFNFLLDFYITRDGLRSGPATFVFSREVCMSWFTFARENHIVHRVDYA